MPLTGYFDVNRDSLGGGAPPYAPLTPSLIMNPQHGLGTPNPNEPDGGWYATNLDTGGSIHPVTGDQYRTLTDSTHSNRELIQSAAKVAALIYGGAALSGLSGAGGGLSNAGLGFGGGAAAAGAVPEEAAGLSEITVPSAGAYLPAESLSGAAAPTLGMAAPVSGVGVGPASPSTGWLDKLTKLGSGGGSSGGGQPQPQFAAPMQPRAGGFLQQVVKPRPNYLGRFADSVMASQQASDALLGLKLFGRERR